MESGIYAFLANWIEPDPKQSGPRGGVQDAQLIAAAVHHKVAGRLLQEIKKEGDPEKASLVRALGARTLAQRAMRMRMLAVLPELARAFEERGMRLLGLKGVAASLQLYGDPLVREGTDLDVLTDSNDPEAIEAAMADCGFVLEMPFEPAGSEWEPDFTRKRTAREPLPHHTIFWKKGEPFRVECHSPRGQDSAGFSEGTMRGFIERSIIARSGAKSSVPWSCRTLDEVDHAIFLIAHGVQHAWCSLHWLLDLAAIVEREEPGFHERLAHSIAALKMGRKLELSLRVYRRVFGRPVPEALAQAGTRGGLPLGHAVEYAISSVRKAGGGQESLLGQLGMMFVYKPSLAGSFGEWVETVVKPIRPTDQDRAIVPLPEEWDFILVFLRPFVVMYKKGRRFLARRRYARHRSSRAGVTEWGHCDGEGRRA